MCRRGSGCAASHATHLNRLLKGDRGRRSWAVEAPAFVAHVVRHLVLDPCDRGTLLMGAPRDTGERVWRLEAPLRPWDEVQILQALSGG